MFVFILLLFFLVQSRQSRAGTARAAATGGGGRAGGCGGGGSAPAPGPPNAGPVPQSALPGGAALRPTAASRRLHRRRRCRRTGAVLVRLQRPFQYLRGKKMKETPMKSNQTNVIPSLVKCQ